MAKGGKWEVSLAGRQERGLGGEAPAACMDEAEHALCVVGITVWDLSYPPWRVNRAHHV